MEVQLEVVAETTVSADSATRATFWENMVAVVGFGLQIRVEIMLVANCPGQPELRMFSWRRVFGVLTV